MLSLLYDRKISVLMGVIAIVISILMNDFNMSIGYQKWIDRGQPTFGSKSSAMS